MFGIKMTRAVAAMTVAGLCLVAVIPIQRYRHQSEAIDGWSHYRPMSIAEGIAERKIKADFLATPGDVGGRYESLAGYFLRAAFGDASPGRARIYYPGEPSNHGFEITGLEGFARTGSLMAAWIASGRSPALSDTASRQVFDLTDFLRQGLLAGTDPHGNEYWGDIVDRDQRIVEAADIARIVWMTRHQIWERLPPGDQAQIAQWLAQTGQHVTRESNWMLFPVTVNAVLRGLNWPVSADEHARYASYKKNYLEHGWFFDPPHGVDFYNAWGISYELFWIDQIDPAFDHGFISDALQQSAELTAHLISPSGLPIMGRSICYRTAVPVPLLAAGLANLPGGEAGRARRALDVVWRYFVARGALQDGTLTQGYFRSDLRMLDLYSGPGSCNWGLRSLVLAFLASPGDKFWTASEQPLPVEIASYRLTLEKLGWVVDGNQATGVITISIPANRGVRLQVEDYGWPDRLREIYRRRPLRPENFVVKYGNGLYSSAIPFFD